MELESIGSYILLTFILGFFSIGLLSNFFFPFFMNENEKINKEYKDIPLDQILGQSIVWHRSFAISKSGDGAIGIVRSNRNVCIRTDVKLLFNITGVTYVR